METLLRQSLGGVVGYVHDVSNEHKNASGKRHLGDGKESLGHVLRVNFHLNTIRRNHSQHKTTTIFALRPSLGLPGRLLRQSSGGGDLTMIGRSMNGVP